MIRNALAGTFKGLARLLRRGGNDAGGFEILNLGAPTLPSSAARLEDVSAALVGAVRKYTVGQAWTNAQYLTPQAAFDAALADGHSGSLAGQLIEVTLYAGVYADPLVIPASLPRWNLIGSGAESGSQITGAVSIEIPNANGQIGISGVRFSGAFSISQAAGTATIDANFLNCVFGVTTITTQRLWIRAYECRFGTANWVLHVAQLSGGRIGAMVCQCSTTGATELVGVYGFGSLTFRGRSIGMTGCLIYYSSTAVTDECTAFSEYTNNAFSRNGGSGAPIVKTGASDLTDGGNVFVDGGSYPFFQITGGARPNRGQTDDQLRLLLSVSGTVVLTPVQVGSQRKTTIYKTNGGGSVTLPAIATVEPGCTVPIVDAGNATASPWIVQGTGGELINGAANVPFVVNNQAREFQATTAGWIIIGGYL